jgi:hypothetical protein
MKKVAALVVGLVAAGGIVFWAVSTLSGNYLASQHKSAASPSSVACQGQHLAHTVIIQDNHMSPEHTQAALCDTLTIINNDHKQREIAFGQHDSHQVYDRVSEKLLNYGDSLDITLNEAGTYLFHDHFQKGVTADFTVQ